MNYQILIQKNLTKNEIITKQTTNLNLNIQIKKDPKELNRRNVYQFLADNYSFKWEQEKKGGMVEVYQGERLIKEISY